MSKLWDQKIRSEKSARKKKRAWTSRKDGQKDKV